VRRLTRAQRRRRLLQRHLRRHGVAPQVEIKNINDAKLKAVHHISVSARFVPGGFNVV
jgi:hypothetical protein